MTDQNNKKPEDTTPDPQTVQSQDQDTSKEKFGEVTSRKNSALSKEKEEKEEEIKRLDKLKQQANETSTERAILKIQPEIQLRRELLIIYANDALIGLGIFFIFVATSIVIHFVAKYTGPLEFLIRIVGWIISALGVICSISFAIKNAYDFIKLLWKGFPKETSDTEVTSSEGRKE